MSYDPYVDEKIREIRSLIDRLERDFTGRGDAEDNERIRRYISFLKADRETMLLFNWDKDGAKFIPQIIHDLCEVEAFLKSFQNRISWRADINFSDLLELFRLVCKDFLALAEDRSKGYYDYGYCIVLDFVNEWEES